MTSVQLPANIISHFSLLISHFSFKEKEPVEGSSLYGSRGQAARGYLGALLPLVVTNEPLPRQLPKLSALDLMRLSNWPCSPTRQMFLLAEAVAQVTVTDGTIMTKKEKRMIIVTNPLNLVDNE